MELRVGVARADITPPIGLPMAGYGARNRSSEGVLEPLSVSAIAFEQGGTACGLIVGDVIGFPAEMTARIRAWAERLCGIAAGSIFVCATHTHWGPEIRREHVPAGLSEAYSDEYVGALGQLAASALAQAWRDRAPAVALAAAGEADLVSFNRRTLRPDGEAEMSWSLPLAQALAASRQGAKLASAWAHGGGRGERLSAPLPEVAGMRVGVTDPTVPVLKLIRPDGSPMAAIFSFACHAVCGAGDEAFYLYSPDYPGRARQAIEAVLGCPAVFLAGCCGDQVPLRRGGDARERIGHSLGAEVIRAWSLVEGDGAGPLRVASRPVKLPGREGKGPGEAEIWAMALGRDWGLVGLPGEVLAGIGLQIRQGSPFGVTSVVELGLDSPGYVPTDAAIEEGGYEPSASPFGEGTEQALVTAGRAALAAVA